MKFKAAFFQFILLTLFVGQHQICFAQESIKLYTIEEFDTKGRPVPLAKESADLIAYIEQSIHIRFDVQRVPWKRAMENALNSDAVLLGMSITKERLKKFAFSDPINSNGNWLVTRCDSSFKFAGLDDLKGKLIGVVLGTTAGDEFDQASGTLFRVENDTGAGISRLQKLYARRMDALVWYGITTDAKQMEAHINRTFVPENAEPNSAGPIFCVHPKAVSIVTNHFAMRINPDKNILLYRINLALLKGRKEGVLPPLRSP